MQQRPYGLWPSVIQPADLAQDCRFGGVYLSPDGSRVAWLEARDDQSVVKLRHLDEAADRLLTPGQRVRAKVGYGGGDFTLSDTQLVCVDQDQGRLCSRPLQAGTARKTGAAAGLAAAPAISPDGAWICYVHQDADEVARLLVSPLEGQAWPIVLHEGHDFYMQPRWSPDGRQVAFVAWDHPQMPWDGSILYLLEVAWQASETDGGSPGLPPGLRPRPGQARAVAGGEDVAVFQPEFSPDGRSLYFISDETGWGHLVCLDLVDGRRRRLTAGEAEHGQPAWVQDMRSYAIAEGGRALYVVRSEQGHRRLYRVDAVDGSTARVMAMADYDEIHSLHADRSGRRLAMVASGARQPPRVLLLDLPDGPPQLLARASAERWSAASLSQPEGIAWEAAGGHRLSGLYYPPASTDWTAEGPPPLVLWIHGGPTAQSSAAWNAGCQFLATRGYAVFALNYRGSSGFGRAFMQALHGAWGEGDVEDAASAVSHLATLGRADRRRVAIMGGSAGGYTVLRAMSSRPELFAAGISMYGISDLLHLAAETHKFEAHYLDRLIGPLPQERARYLDRSPLGQAAHIRRPLALFQGADDRAVPRQQTDRLAAGLASAGRPHLYHVYEGEGHGWRKASTITHFWDAVATFLEAHLVDPDGGGRATQGS